MDKISAMRTIQREPYECLIHQSLHMTGCPADRWRGTVVRRAVSGPTLMSHCSSLPVVWMGGSYLPLSTIAMSLIIQQWRPSHWWDTWIWSQTHENYAADSLALRARFSKGVCCLQLEIIWPRQAPHEILMSLISLLVVCTVQRSTVMGGHTTVMGDMLGWLLMWRSGLASPGGCPGRG